MVTADFIIIDLFLVIESAFWQWLRFTKLLDRGSLCPLFQKTLAPCLILRERNDQAASIVKNLLVFSGRLRSFTVVLPKNMVGNTFLLYVWVQMTTLKWGALVRLLSKLWNKVMNNNK